MVNPNDFNNPVIIDVIIPAYNEEKSIPYVIRDIRILSGMW
ncbi:hypothetical protein V8V91_24070 [Algoriphagus halophilus]